MLYEGSPKDFQAEIRKAGRAATRITEFLRGCPGKQAATAEILTHMTAHDVAGRTAQRALKEMKKDRQLDQPERGTWRLLGEEAPAAA